MVWSNERSGDWFLFRMDFAWRSVTSVFCTDGSKSAAASHSSLT